MFFNRFLSVLAESSPTPEQTPFVLTLLFTCGLYRKPLWFPPAMINRQRKCHAYDVTDVWPLSWHFLVPNCSWSMAHGFGLSVQYYTTRLNMNRANLNNYKCSWRKKYIYLYVCVRMSVGVVFCMLLSSGKVNNANIAFTYLQHALHVDMTCLM